MPSTRRAYLRGVTLGSVAGTTALAGCFGFPTSSPESMLARSAPSPTVGDRDWPAPRTGPRNSGHPGAVGPGNAPGLSWRREIDDDALVRAQPVVASEDLFVVDDRDGTLHCLAVVDGETRWTVPVGSRGEAVAPTVTDGAVYLPAGPTLRRLDREGDEGWRVDVAGAVRGVTAGAERLFVAAADGETGIHALDPATGRQLWGVETDPVLTPPAYADDRVVVGDAGGTVRCLDAATGAVHWEVTVPDGGVRAAPLLIDRTAFVGSGTADAAQGHLAAYDLVTGTELWTVDVGAAVSSVAGAGRRVFVADDEGTLRRFGTDFPRADWTFSPLGPFEEASAVPPDFAPAVSNGLVTYAGPDGRVYVIETDAGGNEDGNEGESVGARSVADLEATGPPTVAGDAAFVATTEGVVAIGRRSDD